MGVVLAAAAGMAPAQAPSLGEAAAAMPKRDVDRDLSDLIRSLDSEQWAPRQRAEDGLREALGDLAALEQALAEIDFELSPEARRRLIRLGEEVFRRSPRPGVGISFTPDSAGDGVRIDRTVSGFDADEHLKRGDVIINFGGIPTPDDEKMRTAIMVHDPEDVVEVTVRRDNEIVSVQLRLGWFRDLNPGSAQQPDRGALRRAWAVRAARYLNPAQDLAADVALAPAVWQGADAVSIQARAQLEQRRRPRAVMVPEVTVAGAPADEDRLSVGGRAGANMANDRRRLIEQEVESLTRRISTLEANLQRLDGEDADATEQIKQQIERLRVQQQQYLSWLELERRRP